MICDLIDVRLSVLNKRQVTPDPPPGPGTALAPEQIVGIAEWASPTADHPLAVNRRILWLCKRQENLFILG